MPNFSADEQKLIADFQQLVNKNQVLYHATFRANLPGIKEKGLIIGRKSNWGFDKEECNAIYFTKYPDIAYGFADCADYVADSVYASGIVVLAIPRVCFDKNYLRCDYNVEDRSMGSYEYHKNFTKVNNIFVMKDENHVAGRLMVLKRVPAYVD